MGCKYSCRLIPGAAGFSDRGGGAAPGTLTVMKTNDRKHQIGLRTLLAAFALLSLWFGWVETVDNQIKESKRIAAAQELAARLKYSPPPVVVFSPR